MLQLKKGSGNRKEGRKEREGNKKGKQEKDRMNERDKKNISCMNTEEILERKSREGVDEMQSSKQAGGS